MRAPTAKTAVDADVPTVTLRGEAVRRAQPDEALLWITLTAIADSPGAALADVAQRSQALNGMFDDLEIGEESRSTAGVSVSEEFDHTSEGRRSLGHRASAVHLVRMTDSGAIGRAITRASEELRASIEGPRWYISLENPIRFRAAEDAAVDARRKAEAYASGVGTRLGRLLGLSEPNDPMLPSRLIRPLGGGHTEMPIGAAELEVGALIDATFTLELD